MFHEAMLAGGVSARRATLMYGGVYWGGPRWSDTVVENARLLLDRYAKSSTTGASRTFYMRGGDSESAASARDDQQGYRYKFDLEDMQELRTALSGGRFALEAVETVVDEKLRGLRPVRL
jgi:hypothetical protein